MNQATYTFINNQDNQVVEIIKFDLLDNPGCRAWQYAVMLNNKSRNAVISSHRGVVKLPIDIDQQYNDLKKTIGDLSLTPFDFDHSVPESFDQVSQKLMNQLHRHFTTSCYRLWTPEFHDFDHRSTVDKILQDLNKKVHHLEQYITTQNKLTYAKLSTPEIWVNDGKNIGYDISHFNQYHSYDHADLILDAYILGKTLIESFRCHDDPIRWDTSGHVRTNGGSCILLGDGRQRIYNSTEFDNWLNDHGIQKHQTRADFPLGNFVSGHKTKLESLKNDLFKYSCQVNIQL
jgi:hypothetical protein